MAYKIDMRAVEGNTTNRLLFNISEQLSEILLFLKPQNNNLQEIMQIKPEQPKSFQCPKCSKTFENNKQLTGHKIKCKGVV